MKNSEELVTIFQDKGRRRPSMGLPVWGRGALSVWYRNFCYFKYTWTGAAMWILLEPLMYLLAIGYGVGSYVENVSGMSYIEFFFPAMLVNTAMTVPFMEATYGSFTKLTQQRTFSTILLTRIHVGEIVWGEIIWAITKGMMGVFGVIIVAGAFGLLNNLMIIPSLLFLILVSFASAGAGLLVTATAKNYNSFIYAISGAIVPMSLFSGTYFPLERFPVAAQWIAKALPLTYGVEAVRGLLIGGWENLYVVNGLVILAFALTFLLFAYRKLRQRLIL